MGVSPRENQAWKSPSRMGQHATSDSSTIPRLLVHTPVYIECSPLRGVDLGYIKRLS